MICSNCGADIGDNETACPYCGAMQYENSEQKYMKDLYNLNEGEAVLTDNNDIRIYTDGREGNMGIYASDRAEVIAGEDLTINTHGSEGSNFGVFADEAPASCS